MTNTTADLTTELKRERLAFQAFLENLSTRRPSELVLIQPPLVPKSLFDVKTARRGGYYNFPPAGLLYVATAARAALPELEVHVIDLNHELLKASREEDFRYDIWQDLIREVLATCKAPHVGVSFMFGTTKPCFEELTRWLRTEFPQAPILVGGVQATYDHVDILSDGNHGQRTGVADIVFRKEGELQIQQYLKACAEEGPFELPIGAAILHEGEVVRLGEPDEDVPMDWDVRAAYDLIEIKDYGDYGCLGAFSHYIGRDKPFATVLGNRGCRARCTFCTVRNFNGFGIRQRTVQNVIDEIKHLVEEKGISYIDWLDDDLLWDPKRTVELFKGLAEQVPGLEWTASNGLIAVAIDEEIMEWMVRSGLQAFKIGIESGNAKMLKQVKKPTTKPKLRKKRELFARYPKVFVSPNFIIGFPEETFAQMLDSFDFARELSWDWSSFYICQPLKGTEIFDAFESLGDDRCIEEGYSKTINPGRAAERGEFGYQFNKEEQLRTGWDIFEIPLDATPDLEQQKEIWFAFNLVANFLDNPCLRPGGYPQKLVRWLEAIHAGYPYDASMAAALSRAYSVLEDGPQEAAYREKFLALCADSTYWQGRVAQFPELLLLAGVSEAPEWFAGEIPTTCVRQLPTRPRPLPGAKAS